MRVADRDQYPFMTPAATSPRGNSFDRLPRPAILLALFAGNIAIWLLYSFFAFEGSALHQDITEAYVWGREFQLGYYKHPPFWAWIAGIWFSFMPHRDWAFYLLALVNANLGLLGAWKLIGCFAGGERRTEATLLLLLTPFYTFLAFKYNANSIFLSLWPWTAYFFVRSLDQDRLLPAALFGLLAAAEILSKYYAAILLASCLVALFFHPAWRRYLASARPFLSLAVCGLLIVPHLWWLATTGFLPFHYLDNERAYSFATALLNALGFLGGCIGLQAGILGAVLLMKPLSRADLGASLRRHWRDARFRFMTVLALGPAILTAIAGVLLHLRLSTNMTLGIFPLMPLLLMETRGVTEGVRARRVAWGLVFALILVSLGVSHLAAYQAFRAGQPPFVDPRREMALEAPRVWHRLVSARLAIVAGNTTYAGAAAFYSDDRPSELIDYNFAYSPWLTPDEVAHRGMLVICLKGELNCLSGAAPFVTANTAQIELALGHEFAGEQTPPVSFILIVVPPQK